MKSTPHTHDHPHTTLADPHFDSVSVQPPIDALRTAGAGRFVARCGQALFLLKDEHLDAAAAAGSRLDLTARDSAPPLRERVDESFSVTPDDSAVMVAWSGGIDRISLQTPGAPRRLAPPPEITDPLCDVRTAQDGATLLCMSRGDSGPDFFRYTLATVHSETRRVTRHAGVDSILPLQLAFSPLAGVFVVYDAYTESLWRIRPAASAAEPIALANVGGRSAPEMLVHGDSGWMAFLMHDANDSRTYLAHGRLTPEGMHWEGVARCEPGLIRLIRWRPGARELAYVRSVRRRSYLEVVNAVGGAIASRELPRGTMVDELCWSSDGQRLCAAIGSTLARWCPTPQQPA